MRDQINNKFEGISHKWLTIPLDSYEFNLVKHAVLLEVDKENSFTKPAAKKLANIFKEKGFAWVKFNRVSGRKNNLTTICQVITEDNYKLELNIPCKSVLELSTLNGTPKSLKLYKSGVKVKQGHNWKKPDDGFQDDIEIPFEDEFTEAGYYLYRDFHLELKEKGLTLEEWHAQRGGPNWRR